MVCCCYCIILRGRMQCGDDLEWPPLIGLRHPASASCLGRHSRLAGRCPNNSSLFPPLAAVVVVALWPCSAEELFYISRLSRSAERSKRIFTGGVVAANDSCSAAFCESAALRGTNPLRHRCAMPPPPKGGGFALLIGRGQKAPPSGELANAVSLRGLAPSQRELAKPSGFD